MPVSTTEVTVYSPAALAVADVTFTDLLERSIDNHRSTPTTTGARLDLRPFELVTIRLSRR